MDASRNVVVFGFNDNRDRLTMDAPTTAEDSVQQAWEKLVRAHGDRSGEVTELYAEWEPSERDARFIAATFPRLERLTHSHARPGPDGWDEALQVATGAMSGQFRADDVAQVTEAGEHAIAEGELLPLLVSASSPRADFLEFMPHQSVVEDRLFVAVAHIAPTPRGTLGVSHFTHHQHREVGSPPFEEVLELAYDNLKRGLKGDGMRTEDDHDLVRMYREGALASAAIALPDFLEQMGALLKTDHLLAALSCPDEIYLVAGDSPLAANLHEMVNDSEYPDTELVPSLVSIRPSGIELLTERR